MIYFSNRSVSGRGGLGCLLSGIIGIVLLYLFFKLLWWAAPALLVLAVIINWRSVADTGKQYLKLLRSNPVMGIIVGVISVLLFPVLSLFLLVQSLAYKQIKGFRDQFTGGLGQQNPKEEAEYVEFEELESTPKTTKSPDSTPL